VGEIQGHDNPRLIVHLGMTGQFTVVDAATPSPDHLHLVFELDNDTELRFRDIRRFGSATVCANESAVEAFFTENGLGPEPFGLDPHYFRTALQATSRNLKAILLDQTLLAGVGNIYADEACFHARLHPSRKGKTLKAEECDRLRQAVEIVLNRSIESRGSTIRNYVGGSGLQGGFQNEFAVYGRTDEPCPVCGTTVQCVRLAGRSSHFCTRCQPSKRRVKSG
jgi:formamidopyrimidine-DNA glycosylase